MSQIGQREENMCLRTSDIGQMTGHRVYKNNISMDSFLKRCVDGELIVLAEGGDGVLFSVNELFGINEF